MLKTQIYHSYEQEESTQLHYAMVDGAMYLTREEGWKEAKIGRVFKAKDSFEISDNKRSIITNAMYVAHLGTH